MSQQREEQTKAAPAPPAANDASALPPAGRASRISRTGEGTDSILPHLRDQEQQRKPLQDQ